MRLKCILWNKQAAPLGKLAVLTRPDGSQCGLAFDENARLRRTTPKPWDSKAEKKRIKRIRRALRNEPAPV